jgi:acyl-CoA reductase-like NAD-dependent aldehyde dehydrogenase
LAVFSFAAEDEAIAKANATPYGLAAGVFTGDLARAHRAAKNLRAGIVWINTYRAVSPIAPIGGFGESGCAREGGADAINDYSREKAVWINTSDAPIGDPFIIR